MLKKIRTILVEDEPLAIRGLTKYIQNNELMELVAVCENAMEAKNVLNSQQIELMFLDISMPKITGLEFFRLLKKRPLTIITSAIPPMVIGHETGISDYLVKPFSAERFNATVLKACKAMCRVG